MEQVGGEPGRDDVERSQRHRRENVRAACGERQRGHGRGNPQAVFTDARQPEGERAEKKEIEVQRHGGENGREDQDSHRVAPFDAGGALPDSGSRIGRGRQSGAVCRISIIYHEVSSKSTPAGRKNGEFFVNGSTGSHADDIGAAREILNFKVIHMSFVVFRPMNRAKLATDFGQKIGITTI